MEEKESLGNAGLQKLALRPCGGTSLAPSGSVAEAQQHTQHARKLEEVLGSYLGLCSKDTPTKTLLLASAGGVRC
jgi:hypothetical protein